MTARQKSRVWHNEPAMYFIVKGRILRLIKGPNGWSSEEPRPLSPILVATDYASLERSIFESFVEPLSNKGNKEH